MTESRGAGRGMEGGGEGRKGRGTSRGTKGRWDGVGELSGTGNCSLLGDDDQVGRKKNRRSI